MQEVTRDLDIRRVLLHELSQTFSDPVHDLILEEFACRGAGARVDVAVVNGHLHGFEIKSDSDTLARLDDQAKTYGKIFDFVTLVCGQKLFPVARKVVPKWWGLRLAKQSDGVVSITDIRQAKKNGSQDKLAIAQLLWKDEALRCLKRNGCSRVTSRNSASQVWDAAATFLELSTLTDEARASIKARGGSGFVKQSIRGGDSSTIESTALLDHYSENLSWLLSRRSARLLY
jgi:hypothetical protein